MDNHNKNKSQSPDGKKVSPPSERSRDEALNIGVLGAGAFALFAVNSFLKISGVKIIGVTDINRDAALQFSVITNAKVYDDLNSLLENNEVDLVYIATPPYLHYQQSKQALLGGKHVICEKPAALNISQAAELHELASANNLLYVVNLMQRYNPLFEIVNKIINKKVFGNFLHGFFENYASDENLGIDHWFWDETKSGGIFIEHGVHFFDLFSGWLGKGEVVKALQIRRPGINKKITDRVHATVMYKRGTVNFYHGFDQPTILDRQEMRLLFERGEITLYGWIPIKMKLHGLIKDEQLELLQRVIGDCSVTYNDKWQTSQQKAKGRFAEIIFDKEITLECGNNEDKQKRYEQLLISMLTDQWCWIKDHNHKRIIDGSNAVESLRMAEQATKIASNF